MFFLKKIFGRRFLNYYVRNKAFNMSKEIFMTRSGRIINFVHLGMKSYFQLKMEKTFYTCEVNLQMHLVIFIFDFLCLIIELVT